MEPIAAQVSALTAKDNKQACSSMKLLEAESERSAAVYPFLDQFADMLEAKSSYVRTRGLVLIAANAKWDTENKIDLLLERVLAHIADPKPITARMCIQSLPKIAQHKPHLAGRIQEALHNADTTRYKDSMAPLLQKEIAFSLEQIAGPAADIPSASPAPIQWNRLFDQGNQPDLQAIRSYVDNPLWDELTDFLKTDCGVQEPAIEFSRCGMDPGWNVKYKQGGRSLCTLYPRSGFFTCLTVIGSKEAPETELILSCLDESIQERYRNVKPLNGSRWLMIDITSPKLLADVKELIQIRRKASKTANTSRVKKQG